MKRLFTMIRKEMLLTMRSSRSLWIFFMALLACGIVFFSFWLMQDRVLSDLAGRTRTARKLFQALVNAELGVFALAAPMLAGGMVSIERERRTMELLRASGLSSIHILLGKWVAVICFVLFLLVALLPIEALVFSLGGVSLSEYLTAAKIIGIAVLSYGMFGLFLSAQLKRSTPAIVAALGILLLMNLGLPLLLIWIYDLPRVHISNTNPLAWELLSAASSPVALSLALGIFGTTVPAAAISPSLNIFYFFHGGMFGLSVLGAWLRVARNEKPPRVKRAKRAAQAEIQISVHKLRPRGRGFIGWLLAPLGVGNPVFDRELRHGTLGRGRALLMLVLLCFPLGASVFIFEPDIDELPKLLATLVLIPCLLLLPAWMATSITSEREEMTWDLLRVSPLRERHVVMGKMAVYLKVMIILAIIICLIPIVAAFALQHFVSTYTASYLLNLREMSHFLADGAPAMTFALAGYVFFFGALMIYWSCRSRTNAAALVSTYATLFFMHLAAYWIVGDQMRSIFPYVDLADWRRITDPPLYYWIPVGLRQIAAPLATPLIYFWHDDVYLHMGGGVLPMIVHTLLLLTLGAALLWRAEACLRRRGGGERGA